MLNQKGQSLIGVIISLGIASILMMIVADLNLVMVKTNTTAQANSDVVGYINTIRSNMQNPDLATKMLQGNDTSGSVTLHDPTDVTTNIGVAGYKQQPQDAWSVGSIAFLNVVNVSPGWFRLTLVMMINRDQTRVIGSASARRIIGDVYCSVAGSTIMICNMTLPPVASVPTPSSGPVTPGTTAPITLTGSNAAEINAGCGSIGGTMSGGTCTIHSGGH